jgi:glyoxylase-like metal-dependent hydrolase (beta-lactamase superfamily II)
MPFPEVTMRATLPAALVLSLLAAAVHSQPTDWSKIETKVEKVAGRVYMLYGVGGFAGGNIGVSVGDDGVLLVDDQFEPLVPKIQAALKGITDKPVRFVLNTHFHGDHTHGNKVFGRSATIVAHDNVRKRMAQDDDFDDKPGTKAPPHALPLVTFDRQVSVHLNGEEIRGLHFPAGHTDGDTVVFFTGSNVVHMGDVYFNGMFPFVDLEGGGTVKGYIAAIEGVLKDLPGDARVIPGHGPLASKPDLQGYLAMLKDTVGIVEKGLQGGKTADQLKKEKVLAAYDAQYGSGFIKTDNWIETIASSLKGVAKNPSF